MIYLDTSAAAKLIFIEPESEALDRALQGQELCGNAIVAVELYRAARRRSVHSDLVNEVLNYITTVEVTASQLRVAGSFETQHLGALDAIHLATALLFDVEAMVTYDKQLAEAARSLGINVVAPA